jgi:hypothetical protein
VEEWTVRLVIEKVYLDTNVFDHMHKRLGVSDGDISALKAAKAKGSVSFLLSIPIFEEVFCAIKSDPVLGIRELLLVYEFADLERVLKPVHLLLMDEIAAYAKGDPRPEPFLKEDDPVLNSLRALAFPAQRDIAELMPVLDESRVQRQEFRDGMRAARNEVLKAVKGLQSWKPSFGDYWGRLAEPFAEGYAERAGVLDECKARGIAGLLALPGVRMGVGINLSLAYAETFDGHAPEMGDSRDQQHGVLASAADVFVTQDAKLANLLTRIPMPGLQIMDLRSFLDALTAGSSGQPGRIS